MTRTNLERLLPKSPLWPGAAVRALSSNGVAVRAVAVRCTPRLCGARQGRCGARQAVQCTPKAVQCTPCGVNLGASVVLEWLNHIIELVLCCSSNRREKRLDYRS